MNERPLSRRMWELIEPLHMVTYFCAESREQLKAVGIKRFWMGYFAGRSAPMGAVGAGVVDAAFFNFAPAWVAAAIPAAWDLAAPATVVEARAAGAAATLRRLVPGIEAEAPKIVPLLNSAVRSANCQGRPLAAANQLVDLPDDPVAALWQCTTTLREHRGDGHVAALVANGIDGVEAHLLKIGTGAITAALVKDARGWPETAWEAATERLTARNLLDDTGALTDDGWALTRSLESTTDRIAAGPYVDGLTDAGISLLPTLLRPMSRAVSASGEIPVATPVGLVPPAAADRDD